MPAFNRHDISPAERNDLMAYVRAARRAGSAFRPR
jgi:hypothetical protein